ncbi:MAG TPA: ACT domain-containing protein [Nitrospiria bacterium]|nr:ACT domain-containing protein [Nitrospiria bacterium]
MNKFIMLTAAGPDRPGIVSRISRVLFDTGCNIEDTSMTLLRGEFAMMLIVRLGPGISIRGLEKRLKPVQKTLRLSLLIKPLSAKEVRRGETLKGRPYILSVYGADHPGIVYTITRLLAARGVSITDMNTRVIGPKTRPVYVMILEVRVPSKTSKPALRSELRKISKTMKVDLTLHPVESARL